MASRNGWSDSTQDAIDAQNREYQASIYKNMTQWLINNKGNDVFRIVGPFIPKNCLPQVASIRHRNGGKGQPPSSRRRGLWFRRNIWFSRQQSGQGAEDVRVGQTEPVHRVLRGPGDGVDIFHALLHVVKTGVGDRTRPDYFDCPSRIEATFVIRSKRNEHSEGICIQIILTQTEWIKCMTIK